MGALLAATSLPRVLASPFAGVVITFDPARDTPGGMGDEGHAGA